MFTVAYLKCTQILSHIKRVGKIGEIWGQTGSAELKSGEIFTISCAYVEKSSREIEGKIDVSPCK